MELNKLKNFQIVREHTLQVSNDICAFYNGAKIIDLETNKEEYIREDLVDLIFPMFDKYAVTQMKRNGAYDFLEAKEELKERI